MARKLRVEYPGAIYHVMSRGDRREPIFKDDTDRKRFVETLGEACAKTGWRVHAWCLMENHFHIVIETPRANLVSGMKWLLSVSTGRFNRRHRLCGHLFSGRYKALVVDGSRAGYLKTVCDYVHLNPVRAGLLPADRPLAVFFWSSYRLYLLPPSRRPNWLNALALLGEHGIPKDSAAGRREFALRMEQRRRSEDKGQWEPLRRGWYLGQESFRQELLARMTKQTGENHYGEEARQTELERAEVMACAELKKAGLSEEELSRRRKGDQKKARVAMRLRQKTSMTLRWIAQRLQMGTPGSLANRLRSWKEH